MVATAQERRRTREAAAALSEAAWAALLIGAFLLYYLVPGLPLSLALLVLCAVLCYVQLPLAVSLVPLAMPFFMLPKHLGHPNPEFSLSETAIVLCAANYMVQRTLELRAWRGDVGSLVRHYVPESPLERPVALFFVAATAATLAAHFRHFALQWYRPEILEPIVYYVLVVALLRDVRSMMRVVWALAGAGLVTAILGIGQYLFRYNALSGVYFTGTLTNATSHALHLITSVYGSPDNLALLLDRAIPVAVVLGLVAWVAARRKQVVAAWLPYLPWLAAVLMFVAQLLTGSRGGIITTIAVCLLAAYIWYGRRDRRLELAGLGIVIAGAAAVLIKEQHGLSTSRRLDIWKSAAQMIRDHPLFGVGPDNFLYYYFDPKSGIDKAHPQLSDCVKGVMLPAKHYMNPNDWQEPCLSHPHNMVLDAWLSTGIVGLIALAVILVGFAVLARRNLLRFPAGWQVSGGLSRTVQVACLAVVGATVIHGMVDNSIFLPDLAVDFWLALALTCNLAALKMAQPGPL